MTLRFPTPEELRELHRKGIDIAGGSAGDFNDTQGRLESVIGSLENLAFYEHSEVPQLACHLALRLARMHPFQDGNKRCAYLAARFFAFVNGYRFHQEDWEIFAEAIVAVLSREIQTDEAFIELVAPLFRPE